MKKFNYNLLYNNYKDNLLNKLRAFGNGDELSLWVANEDISISVLNLIDAVEDDDFLIDFDKESYDQIKKKFLKDKLNAEGKLTFYDEKHSLKFLRSTKIKEIIIPQANKVKLKKKNDKYEITSDINVLLDNEYISNLKKVKNKKKPKIINNVLSSLIKLKYKDDKCSLDLFINPSNHYVLEANFLMIKNEDIIKSFGNYVVDLIINLPINEVKDHLLIKIESNLRPDNATTNKGIVLKHSKGKIFIYFQEILNKLYFEYIKKTNTKFGINFYNHQLTEEWLNLTNEIKKKKVIENLTIFNLKYCKDTPLELIKIDQSNRLFFSLDDLLSNKFDNSLFIKLEKFLNSRLDVKFEVYYVNRKDENSLRSL